jgi:DNA (cytosine-5)-methyltransferase 1
MPSLAACERLQGFPSGWTAAANDHHGKRPEWRLIGNAVSVPVARWVAERIKKPGAVLEFVEHEIVSDRKWPDAGWNVDERRVGVSAGDHPVELPRPSISTFRDSACRLSNRALDGFIRRAVEGGLSVPQGFLDALRQATRKVAAA